MKLIFEWDKDKANSNLRNHKISFDEAKTIFNDPPLITFPDEINSSHFVIFSLYQNVMLHRHFPRKEI